MCTGQLQLMWRMERLMHTIAAASTTPLCVWSRHAIVKWCATHVLAHRGITRMPFLYVRRGELEHLREFYATLSILQAIYGKTHKMCRCANFSSHVRRRTWQSRHLLTVAERCSNKVAAELGT